MNRREAIAALTSLPMLSQVSVADLKADDVIVAECDDLLGESAITAIKDQLEKVWPNQRIVVCDRGLRLKVVRKS